MTPEQKTHFKRQGYLLFKNALSHQQLRPIKEHVFEELKRLKIWSSGKTLSSSVKELPMFQQTAKLGQLIKCPNLQEKIVTPELQAAMDALAQTKLALARDAQFLI